MVCKLDNFSRPFVHAAPGSELAAIRVQHQAASEEAEGAEPMS